MIACMPKLACLRYSCHHGPQKWTLPIPLEPFSALLNFRTEPVDFILSAGARVGRNEGQKKKKTGKLKWQEN